ncbi:ash family protein [Enterobacter sp.]|uniref:ash family protein n=1 Tax=Enterobacter sp. TaxID=42895 RepID=UPI00296FB6B5|nr:ash family protein [Enterobacter sp.]
MTRLRLFLCRSHGYTSMAGRAGASQDAPVSSMAGKANPVRSATREISLSSGGIKTSHTGGCHYGYDPQPESPVTHRSL